MGTQSVVGGAAEQVPDLRQASGVGGARAVLEVRNHPPSHLPSSESWVGAARTSFWVTPVIPLSRVPKKQPFKGGL